MNFLPDSDSCSDEQHGGGSDRGGSSGGGGWVVPESTVKVMKHNVMHKQYTHSTSHHMYHSLVLMFDT